MKKFYDFKCLAIVSLFALLLSGCDELLGENPNLSIKKPKPTERPSPTTIPDPSSSPTPPGSTPVPTVTPSPTPTPTLVPGPTAVPATPVPVGSPTEYQVSGIGPFGYDDTRVYSCTGTSDSSPNVLCVDGSNANDVELGTQLNPFRTIQLALSLASNGDIIQVAEGLYQENLVFGERQGVGATAIHLLGGFESGNFSNRDAAVFRTRVDGSLQSLPVLQLYVGGDLPSSVDGFEFFGGTSSFSVNSNGSGGGIYAIHFGSNKLTLSHNEVHGCSTVSPGLNGQYGGGMYLTSEEWAGSGVEKETIVSDSYIHDNQSGRAAGIAMLGSKGTLVRNRIENNIAHGDHGGGIDISARPAHLIENVVIGNEIGRTAGYGWGGGVFIPANLDAHMIRNIITDNYAPSIGSGVFWDEGSEGTMYGDLIYKNRCSTIDGRSGAAIYVDGGSSLAPNKGSIVNIENVTVADHACTLFDAPGSGGAVFVDLNSVVTVKNSIFWGNSSRDFGSEENGTFSVSYSITQEAAISGNEVFHENPLFVNAGASDYHLRSTEGHYDASLGYVQDSQDSPALDAGDPSSAFASEPSPNGGVVDLGAYGNSSQSSLSVE